MARIIRPDVEAAMTLALTRSIGRFIEDLTFDQIPAAAVPIVATGFTDCIACGIAGLDEPVVRIVRDALPTRKDSGEATLLTDATRASAPDAALLNAVAGHVLDYDDVALFGHPSVVMVPAILAEGEALGVTGRDAVSPISLATRCGAISSGAITISIIPRGGIRPGSSARWRRPQREQSCGSWMPRGRVMPSVWRRPWPRG
jgi:hypothetical protein